MTAPDPDPTRLPRWVKIAGLAIAIVAILGVLMVVLLGGGEHGPRRHGNQPPSINTPAPTSTAAQPSPPAQSI